MSLPPEQAAEMLRDVETTKARSRELYRYRCGGPYLILWGALWLIAYPASVLVPRSAWIIWALAICVGIAGGAAHGYRTADAGLTWNRSWQYLGSSLAIAMFVSGTYLVLPPTHPIQFGAFPPLVVALGYAIAGIWWLPRFLWLGGLLFLLTLGGYEWLYPWFAFWMACVGGGGLILGGLWLRSA